MQPACHLPAQDWPVSVAVVPMGRVRLRTWAAFPIVPQNSLRQQGQQDQEVRFPDTLAEEDSPIDEAALFGDIASLELEPESQAEPEAVFPADLLFAEDVGTIDLGDTQAPY